MFFLPSSLYLLLLYFSLISVLSPDSISAFISCILSVVPDTRKHSAKESKIKGEQDSQNKGEGERWGINGVKVRKRKIQKLSLGAVKLCTVFVKCLVTLSTAEQHETVYCKIVILLIKIILFNNGKKKGNFTIINLLKNLFNVIFFTLVPKKIYIFLC